jgi:hypothetical protein
MGYASDVRNIHVLVRVSASFDIRPVNHFEDCSWKRSADRPFRYNDRVRAFSKHQVPHFKNEVVIRIMMPQFRMIALHG